MPKIEEIVAGKPWEWGRTTDLGVIGSYTRTARMHIDLETTKGREKAEKFWHYIWEAQKWNDTGESKRAGC